MTNLNMNNIKSAKGYADTKALRGASKLSLSITYTEHNSKRLSFSKGILNALAIGKTIYIGLIPDDRQIVVSGSEYEGLDKYKLSANGTIYSAELVSGIVNAFQIKQYFQNHTSITFNDTEISESANYGTIKVPDIIIESEEEDEE